MVSTAPAKQKARASNKPRTTAAGAGRQVSSAKATAGKSVRRATSSARRTAGSGSRRPAPAKDAIVLLKEDHRSVEKLFKAFERAGEKAFATKRKLVAAMIAELSTHAAIEEQFFYPAVRKEAPRAKDDVLEALEEHHVAKWILSELLRMEPDSERFDAKVTVLIESVRHHIREEEHTLFPEVRSILGRKELLELGGRLQEGKKLAPQRPHPRSPDEPPGNLIVGAVSGVVDRARTAVASR
jgi:hemerythrin superfamily protein